jgi:tight adherence protein B
MDLLTLLFLIAVFLFAATLVELAYLAWARARFKDRWTVRKRLLYMSAGGRHGSEKLALYKNRALDNAGWLEKFAFSLPRLHGLDRMLLRAGFAVNASSFILGSLGLGCLGLVVGIYLLPHWAAAILPAVGLLFLPFLSLKMMETRALNKFDEQLPEALDLLGRSLRSGLALSAGMEVIVQEMEDPLQSEFAAAVDEINLGLSFKEALENMCDRVPSRDLRFFVVATLIQRETGGNIAEILDQISTLVRERMKFKRHVRALTAEGRLSGVILLGLPVVMAIYMYFVSYDYLSLLWTDKIGHLMIALACIGMVIGTLVIKKIVRVEI